MGSTLTIYAKDHEHAERELKHYGCTNIMVCLKEFRETGLTKFRPNVQYSEIIIRKAK